MSLSRSSPLPGSSFGEKVVVTEAEIGFAQENQAQPNTSSSSKQEKASVTTYINSGLTDQSRKEISQSSEAIQTCPEEDLQIQKDVEARNSSLSSFSQIYRKTIVPDELIIQDIIESKNAIDLYISGYCCEAEAILLRHYRKRLYSTLSYSVVLTFRALMTFHEDDMERAANAFEAAFAIAKSMRKSNKPPWAEILWRGPTVKDLKSFTMSERHGELVYAETRLFLAGRNFHLKNRKRDLLKLLYSIKCAQTIYSSLQKFIEEIEQEADNGVDISKYNIDKEFSHGIALGVGFQNVLFSFTEKIRPKWSSFVGLVGDREFGLMTLSAIGSAQEEVENMPLLARAARRGDGISLRKIFCDILLAAYHFLLSSFIPNPNFNLNTAIKLAKNLNQLNPHSLFYLTLIGKVYQMSRDTDTALRVYNFIFRASKEERIWLHVTHWEAFLCYCSKLDWVKALRPISTLAQESMWSNAGYLYHKAVVMYTLGHEASEVEEVMQTIQHLVSKDWFLKIPIEKFVARKARKFILQGYRLFLPLHELLYIWHVYDLMDIPELHMCLELITNEIDWLEHLLRRGVRSIPTKKEKSNRKQFLASPPEDGQDAYPGNDNNTYVNFWDDYCLGYLLKGVVANRLAFRPRRDANTLPPYPAYYKLALQAFDKTLAQGSKIALDHYIFYFASFERARTLMYLGDIGDAMSELHALRKNLNLPQTHGKYSFRKLLMFQIENVLFELQELREAIQRDGEEVFITSNTPPNPRSNPTDVFLRRKSVGSWKRDPRHRVLTASISEYFRKKVKEKDELHENLPDIGDVSRRYLQSRRYSSKKGPGIL
ncbi:uncharacterized protein VTP21DRAFT_1627 [Calcarisporiella thermophila]|uniref:uncharacterized protein n=1 Tax=Calcarisporiella thermophila TaxID=911321 RepID=UPI003742EFF5